MKKVLIALAVCLAFVFSCSDNKGGDKRKIVKKEKISGVSQKGPFVRGSKVIVRELDSSFAETGVTYRDSITDELGRYELKQKLELASPYILIEVTGKYRNEITGSVSVLDITLTAIVDVSNKNTANVNVLTHLECQRILKLAAEGKSIDEAKKQAQSEVLKEFGIEYANLANSEDMSIFGNTQSDAVLLAVSVLLLGNKNETELASLLSEISDAIEEAGAWNDNEAKAQIASGLSEADLASIKENINQWLPSATIGNFEQIIKNSQSSSSTEPPSSSSTDDIQSSSSIESSSSSETEPSSSSEEYLSSSSAIAYSSFYDERDGQKYKTVVIGEQTWMAENLNYAGSSSSIGVCYEEKDDNCKTYGRFYNWNEVNPTATIGGADSICPSGWHVPSKSEWEELKEYVRSNSCPDESRCEQKYLMVTSWDNGSDDYGFSALLGGFCKLNGGNDGLTCEDKDSSGYWWSSTDEQEQYSYMNITDNSALIKLEDGTNIYYSVRCIKDMN